VLSFRASSSIVLLAALAALPALGTTTHHSHPAAASHSTTQPAHRTSASSTSKSANSTSSHSKHGAHKKAAPKLRGQQAITPERVTQIQQALIREHYLDGEADGRWDERTKAAMLKYQADQGWQTKLTPDSRALKKLGLGPDYSNAINAKNSSFAPPPPSSTIPPAQTEGFAEAAGVKQ
jgi:hypothetical protein